MTDLSALDKARPGTRFTGIGSRETPADVLTLFSLLGRTLALRGLILRSGCADGADAAFEKGARAGARVQGLDSPWELFLPWPTFNGKGLRDIGGGLTDPTPAAVALAAKTHPAWAKCSQGAKKLHARNSHQVFGPGLNKPSAFVICWTEGGKGGGGTGQALRLAIDAGIPIFDAGIEAVKKALIEWEWANAPEEP